MEADGTCPFCKQVVDYSRHRKFEEASARGEELAPETPVPWHLKLLLAAAVIYLGWRLVEGVGWVVDRF
jgi:hypothetical protein